MLLVFPSALLGLTTDLTNDPAKVVEKYLSLDKRGARLNALSYEALRPYTAWGEEPAWGQVVVIAKYEVAQNVKDWEVVSPVEAVIPVTYQVIGVIQWEAVTFLKEVREEVLHFRIKAVDNQWKIVSPPFPPHVGRKRLIDFVREKQVSEDGVSRGEKLHYLREALEQAG